MNTPKPSAALPQFGIAEFNEIVVELVDSLDAMLAYWDTNQVCVFANNAYRAWFGKTREQMVGLTMKELLGPLYPMNLPHIKAALEGQKQIFERAIPTPDGSIRHSLATYTPRIVNGEVLGIFVHVADVTPLKVLEQALQQARLKAEEMATHDFLTGLPNRVLLQDRIIQALARAKRKHGKVAVVSLDIDNFKSVNDKHGHGAGDQLLIETSARLRSTLRESDTAIRLGGDEFLLLISDMESIEEVEHVAQRVMQTSRRPVRLDKAVTLPTFSMGIAVFPDHGVTPEELMDCSDRALYKAKELGRNRYVFGTRNNAGKQIA